MFKVTPILKEGLCLLTPRLNFLMQYALFSKAVNSCYRGKKIAWSNAILEFPCICYTHSALDQKAFIKKLKTDDGTEIGLM